MKTSIVILSILLFFTLSTTKVFAQKDLERQVFAKINEYRSSKGLKPLVENEKIVNAAREHSKDMAAGNVPFGHAGFDERTGKLMRELAPANACAENVAEGVSTADEVVNLWLHSPGHRRNIEGDYTLTGIGIAENKDGAKYYTQIFIRKE